MPSSGSSGKLSSGVFSQITDMLGEELLQTKTESLSQNGYGDSAMGLGAKQHPSNAHLTLCMSVLAGAAFIWFCCLPILGQDGLKAFLKNAGVCLSRVAGTAQEIERKSFHLAGLLVPLIYQGLLDRNFTQDFCCQICWTISIVGVSMDFARTQIDFVRRNWPLGHILRENEQKTLCGGAFFSLGCTVSIWMFAPSVAMTSILFLILGDMSAALIGRSFGGEVLKMRKIGRDGKKSIEGSLAMFTVNFLLAVTVFHEVHLREYPAFCGALIATITELYEPFNLNDNLTIPLFGGLGLAWGFARIENCQSESPSDTIWRAIM
mmetsp:Transcript_37432/g.85699  ORF Transcript_37432/g.85699 Transcript_37432/m.85699 type:complete len:321 (-) Transcript_37432:194-1156(-)